MTNIVDSQKISSSIEEVLTNMDLRQYIFRKKVENIYGGFFKTLKGHAGYVYSVNRLPNGNIVSCSHDQSIKIWTTY